MKRRNFVQSVALSSIGVPLVLKNFKFGAVTEDLFETSKSAQDRVLVIIRLNGGNDGLNTLVPLDQYANLSIQRSNILIPQNQLLTITPANALHPSMSGMRDMFNNERLSIIQNVGYPEQNRSHFRSMDIWTSGMLDQNATRGWLGRYLDQEFPNFPDDYPDTQNPDPFAISMGYEVSATCQGLAANFSVAINNPFDSYNLVESGQVNDGTYYGSHMEYLSTLITQANAYGAQVNAAANAGSSLSTMYDPNDDVSKNLKYIAQMISGGLKTKIYIVNVNGFDTHDAQVVSGAPTTGTHANLLSRVSTAVAAFQNDLSLLGLENRVAGMTFSEFGRQVASNASDGTDHGDAAPLFLFGACISSGIVGPNPVISNTIVDQVGVPMQIDFRDVYASILRDWFEADATEIQGMFEQTINFIPVLDSCNLGLDEHSKESDVLIFPNPCVDQTTLKFKCSGEKVTIRVYDTSGTLISEVCSKEFQPGEHLVPIDMEGKPSGNYIITIHKNSGTFNKKFIKLKNI
ncbi:DUF1501 domain-containing protein [Fluviicola taffensis]|uniref:DUF1501 domain-containing protein n=1 Tax=Fluviicola taffensis TaxID=191579 RepID=UPI00313774BC